MLRVATTLLLPCRTVLAQDALAGAGVAERLSATLPLDRSPTSVQRPLQRRFLVTGRGNRSSASEAGAPQGQAQSIRVMTFNVQFYAQMSRVLAELEKLEISYGPFKHSGLARSSQGRSLQDLAAELPPLSSGDAGFEAYKALPVVKGNFRAITEFLRAYAPDLVALQEGNKGMDIVATGENYDLQVVATAEAERHFATKGVLVNQVLLNRGNPQLKLGDTWSLTTKAGGANGAPEFADSLEGDRDVPRAAAGVRVHLGSRSLDFVSIHLTGGRFDDRHWKQYRQQRFQEIQRVIDEKFDSDVPMLLLGDFNAPSTPEEVDDGYGRALGADNAEELEIFKEYMVGVHEELKARGWTPAYTKDDLPRPTSVFGSSVDWVYASPNWPQSWKIGTPSVPDVVHASSESWAEYPAGSGTKLSLSDHNPVILDILVSSE